MPKVLKILLASLGAFALSTAVALAQTTPPPDAGTAQTPTSTHSKPRTGGSKKSGHHKRAGKKKAAKKLPQ